MIKTINAGRYLKAANFGGAYIDAYTSGQQQGAIGTMRYNPSAQNIEVWDGNSWRSISGHSDISLDQEAIELLDWAREERNRQRRYAELAKNNVTIADALESVKDAELRLRELSILCQEGEKITNNI